MVSAVLALLVATCAPSCAQTTAAKQTGGSAWQYRADWSGGFAGWMSFPLAQDVGYDPSLYTENQGNRTVLLRDVKSHGEPRLWIGFLRPLKFTAGPQMSCAIDYEFHAPAPVTGLSIQFGAADGHQYSLPLPGTNGEHRVRITGAQLGLQRSTAIDIVVLKGVVLRPQTGSNTRWTLKQFVLDATRPSEVVIRQPLFNESSDGSAVARTILDAGEPLEIAWGGTQATTIALKDPSGQSAVKKEFRPGVNQASISVPSSAKAGLWHAEVSQGAARSDFDFLVLGAITPHPRLLLSEKRLEQLRGPEFADLRKQIHERGAGLAAKITYSAQAGDNIEAMPVGIGIDAAYPSEITPYFQLMDSYSQSVAYNALVYRLNGNDAALDSARRALLTMTKWKTWTPRRFHSHGVQTYYEVGVAAQLVALGYDLIADHLSAQEKSEVEQAFWKQVIAPTVQEYYTADRDPIAASNWMANSLGGALASAISVAGDVPDWKQRDGAAVAQLQSAFERLMRGLFPGDGSEAEPLGYENFALQGFSWGTSALAALGIEPLGKQGMLEGFWWPYYTTVAPGLQLDTGDFNGHLTKLPGFAWGAEHSGIPELRAYYEKNAGRPDLSHGAPVSNNGHFLEEMPGPLDLACCTGPAPEFSEPPPSRVFAERGSAVLRSGWDTGATVISLRAGPWFNHEHHDQGSFQVAAFGSRLIDEAGYAHYYLDPRYPDYFTQAPGHNTVLVDGNPFSQQATNGRYWPGFAHPEINSQVLSPDFDYVRADLTAAYDGALRSYRREYFFLKPGVMIVRDRIESAQPHVYSWLLHAAPGAQLTSETGSASIQTPHASAALMALGQNTRWSAATTPLPISVYENLDKPRIPTRPELVLTSGKTATTQFLVAMEFVRGAANGAQLQQWSDANGVGVRTQGAHPERIIFRTAPGLLQVGDFATDGSALRVTDDHAEWSAIEAHSVEQGSRVMVRSESPVDLEMTQKNGRTNLTVHNASADSLQIHTPNPPKRVVVDGKTVAVNYEGSGFALRLAPGEHHVSIQ